MSLGRLTEEAGGFVEQRHGQLLTGRCVSRGLGGVGGVRELGLVETLGQLGLQRAARRGEGRPLGIGLGDGAVQGLVLMARRLARHLGNSLRSAERDLCIPFPLIDTTIESESLAILIIGYRLP